MNGSDIAKIFTLNSFALAKNVEGISEDASLKDTGAGSTINWVLGHILSTRRGIAKVAGLEMPWTKEGAEAYGRGSSPAANTNPVAMEEILAELEENTKTLLTWLEEQTDADLKNANPDGPHEIFGATIGETILGLAWHEGYHVGQVGTLRRLIGLDGAIA